MSEYENFRSAFAKGSREIDRNRSPQSGQIEKSALKLESAMPSVAPALNVEPGSEVVQSEIAKNEKRVGEQKGPEQRNSEQNNAVRKNTERKR